VIETGVLVTAFLRSGIGVGRKTKGKDLVEQRGVIAGLNT
jgi:hypothetical protein